MSELEIDLFVNKSIIDINYDGDMKFVINRQPCCLKMRIYIRISDVQLYVEMLVLFIRM